MSDTKQSTTQHKRKKAFSAGQWVIILICLIVFCGSAAYLLTYTKDKLDAEKDFGQLREDAADLSQLYAENNDLLGWIKVDDTKIDYPVMYTPDDPEAYLHADFNKAYSASGTPFLDGDCVVFGDGKTWDWLIYGHNMKIGTMFADLQEFESEEFRQEHLTFTFDVYDPKTGNTEHGEYEIFAVSRSQIRAEDSDAFKYYVYAGSTDPASFDEYVAGVKAESCYDSGITPQFGEQLVTLSTCAYHTDEGRFYVVGRRIK